jgi:pimeloyl-ACP methyl ester carboxylesterase
MRNAKRVKFDASRLAVASGGTGEPAVFVHGLGSNKFIWKRVCDGLRDVFSFYAIDLPGCGESPAPTHFRYTLEHFADVLTDFIVMKDLKKLTLVGTSFGGAVILIALLRNKDELASRVRRTRRTFHSLSKFSEHHFLDLSPSTFHFSSRFSPGRSVPFPPMRCRDNTSDTSGAGKRERP